MVLTEKLPKETGREFALRTLKENIIHLKLEPGARVSESELSSQMGLSRTPVREALLELSKVKIVEIYPQRGSAIALIDYEQVEESQFMRRVLEAGVVKLCCELATPQDVEKLKELVKLQSFYLDQGDNEEKQMALDNEFHEQLFNIAKKPQVFTLMRNIAIHFDRLRSMTLLDVSYEAILEDHHQIIETIENKDVKKAEEVMELHLNRFRMAEQVLHQRYPHYFKKG